MDQYPSLRPAESFVFCVDDACIFEALNWIIVVNDFDIMLFVIRPIMFIYLLTSKQINFYIFLLNYYFIHLFFKTV